MNRSRITGDLVSQNNIFVDIANDRVGIGSTIPGQKLSLPDSAAISLGDSADLRISFDGGNAVIRDHTGNGSMRIANNNQNIQIEPVFGQFSGIFKPAEVMLFHSNALKFQTTAYGINVTGTTDTDGLVVSGVATVPQLGVNLDTNGYQIFTSQSNGNIPLQPNGTGAVEVKGAGGYDGTLQLNCSSNSHAIKLKSPPHSAAQTYTLTFPSSIVNNGFLKTDSSGNLSFAAVNTDLENDTSPTLGGSLGTNGHFIQFADSTTGNQNKAVFGGQLDLQIYHDGSHSYIHDGGTGNLKLRSNNFRVSNADESKMSATFVPAGAVELYNNHSKKFETTSSGIDVTGTVTADNQIVLNSGDSTPARIDLYCEVSNAHYTRLQAPAHSTYSGNVTATLPNVTGNLAVLANAADNRVVTATGTHAMTGEANLTFDGTNVLEIASGYPRVRVKNTGTSASANDIFGAIEFEHSDTDDAGITAKIQAVAEDSTGNSFLAFYNGDGGNADERLRITSTGNLGVAGATGTDFSLLDGMVINTANGSAGLLINSSSSSHNAYLGFSYGSGSSTSHNDQFSAYIGRVGDNNLILGTNNSIRVQVTSSGHVVPGADSTYDLGLTGTRWRNLYADTLYGDGSNLTGINADLVNDTSPQLGGDLDTNSFHINLDDDHAVRFGNSNDLQIYHNNSANTNEFTSALSTNFRGKNLYFYVANNVSSESAIMAYANAQVELYHNNVKKVTTDDESVFIENGGLRITNNQSHFAANISECNHNRMALLCNQTRQGETIAFAMGAIGDTNSKMGFQSFDTSDNSAHAFNINPYGGSVTINGLNATANAGADNLIIGSTSGTNGITIKSGTTGYGRLYFSDTDSTSSAGQIEYHHGNEHMDFYGNGQKMMRIDATEDEGQLRFTPNVDFSGSRNSNVIRETFILNTSQSSNQAYHDNHHMSFGQTSGNWQDGTGGHDTSWGLMWHYSANASATRQCRAGIAFDHKGTEQFKIWSSYGDIVFYQDLANSGSETAESCDTECARFDANGHFVPGTNNARDLGTSSKKWRNIYVMDMHFSNEGGSPNSVDGTTGNWTLQEGADGIYMINNKNGKKYEMMLKEVQ